MTVIVTTLDWKAREGFRYNLVTNEFTRREGEFTRVLTPLDTTKARCNCCGKIRTVTESIPLEETNRHTRKLGLRIGDRLRLCNKCNNAVYRIVRRNIANEKD